MKKILIILSCPHSFSSLISTMIGQHPELYDFPELNLFSALTVEEIITKKSSKGKVAPSGLLRTLAQEHDGLQTTATILKAIDWLIARKNWTTKKLFDYLIELINPKIGIEKTPSNAKRKKYLQRAYNYYPHAYFLHLTRHPLSTCQSMVKMTVNSAQKNNNFAEGLLIWYSINRNIINFTQSLPLVQTMKIKGEDLLSQPDLYLQQIAQWLDISTEEKAILSMKHPENSPYAYFGPFPCQGGNERQFMQNPIFTTNREKEPILTTYLREKKQIKTDFKNHNNKQQHLTEDILNLSKFLGYN